MRRREELDPWPVLRGLLMGVRSYDVPDVVDRTGLSVDWRLTEKQDWSHATRLSVYRSRIDAAYDGLAKDDDRLRVAFILARELAKRGLADEMDKALSEIGWKIQDNGLAPANARVRELFFPPQSQHDAYVEMREIFKKAAASITIVDGYLDESILTLMATCVKAGMTLQLLSAKLPGDFPLEAKKWMAQHAGVTLQVRTARDFHDRFIVLDGGECWHVGCSIKDAGNRGFMLSQVEDDNNRAALIAAIQSAWDGATPVSLEGQKR